MSSVSGVRRIGIYIEFKPKGDLYDYDHMVEWFRERLDIDSLKESEQLVEFSVEIEDA